jgi:succinate dehydrogenase/fumarate reductase-like Fe-S protein
VKTFGELSEIGRNLRVKADWWLGDLQVRSNQYESTLRKYYKRFGCLLCGKIHPFGSECPQEIKTTEQVDDAEARTNVKLRKLIRAAENLTVCYNNGFYVEITTKQWNEFLDILETIKEKQ